MKIFITGASGFAGSCIAEFFLKKKYKVIGSFYNNPIKIKHIRKLKLILTKKILIKDNIDTIIHCASRTPVNCKNSSLIFNQNVKMMKNLLDLSSRKNVKNFIFLSSVSAYGKINKKTLFENNRSINPNRYGQSKIICENLLYDYAKKQKSFKFLSLRLPIVVGKGSHSNFISETTKKIINNDQIKASNKSSYFNNIIFIDDLSKFLLNYLKYKNCKFLYVNVASFNKMKISNVINYIYQRLKRKKNIEWSKSKSPAFCINFRNALKCGFKPSSVKNSLKKYTSLYL